MRLYIFAFIAFVGLNSWAVKVLQIGNSHTVQGFGEGLYTEIANNPKVDKARSIGLAGAASTLAHAKSIAHFKNLFPDGVYQGTMMVDYTCQIKARWISDTELEVETSLKYKNNIPSVDTLIFSDAKKADFMYLRLNEAEIMAEVGQSKVIYQEEDYKVTLSDKIELGMNDTYQIKEIQVHSVEWDMENDPHENVYVICENIKKVK